MSSAPPEAEPTGVRARARKARLDGILSVANQHLAETGAAALSLRAIAREVGIVSSAIHRYFPTRDDLLTALIVEAYDSLGQETERSTAATRGRAPADRWLAAATTIRTWAIEQPHRWALLYGTPVPGYAAPERTIEPGIRVSLALLSIVEDAAVDGTLRSVGTHGAGGAGPPDDALVGELDDLIGRLGLGFQPAVLLPTLTAWTQLFGLVSFELFGQTRGMVSDHEALFVATTNTMAELIGLPGSDRSRG